MWSHTFLLPAGDSVNIDRINGIGEAPIFHMPLDTRTSEFPEPSRNAAPRDARLSLFANPRRDANVAKRQLLFPNPKERQALLKNPARVLFELCERSVCESDFGKRTREKIASRLFGLRRACPYQFTTTPLPEKWRSGK